MAPLQVSSQKHRPYRKWLFRLFSLFVTVGMMAIILSFVEWDSFFKMVQQIPLWSVLVAGFAYFTQNFFRAIRFRILLNEPNTPLKLLVPITMYHNFLVRVLPFKLGEISYVVLLKQRLGYSVESGISTLFGARIFELLIVIVMCSVGITFSHDSIADQRDVINLIIGATFILSVLGLYFAGSLLRLFNVFLARVLPDRLAGVGQRLDELASQLDTMRQPRLFAGALFVSFFTNVSSIILNIVLMQAVGVNVSFAQFLAIVGIGQFASAFPFSVSGFGVIEGSWTLGLYTFAGYSLGDAAAIGVLLHSFQVSASTVYGILGYIIIRLIPDDEKLSHEDESLPVSEVAYK